MEYDNIEDKKMKKEGSKESKVYSDLIPHPPAKIKPTSERSILSTTPINRKEKMDEKKTKIACNLQDSFIIINLHEIHDV
jgi:hypothetical protein